MEGHGLDSVYYFSFNNFLILQCDLEWAVSTSVMTVQSNVYNNIAAVIFFILLATVDTKTFTLFIQHV